MKAFIICGGQGLRLKAAGIKKPKSLVVVDGKSVLQEQLEFLKYSGISVVGLGLGHQGESIANEGMRLGNNLGIKVDLFQEPEPLGTGGSILNSIDFFSEPTLVLYGDILFDLKIDDAVETDWEKFVAGAYSRYTEHPEDSDLMSIGIDNQITKMFCKPHSGSISTNLAFTGMFVVTPQAVDFFRRRFESNQKFDLERQGFRELLDTGYRLKSLKGGGFIRDMGTPDRLNQVRGEWSAWKKEKWQKLTVLVDRDGVINVDRGHVKNLQDFRLIPGSIDAITQLKRLGVQIFIVTNQPVIARGEASWDDVQSIHSFVSMSCLKAGGAIDDFFVCPHHPISGFEGEIAELKIQCKCRKPDVLMYEQIKKFYFVNQKKVVMIGDSDSDEIFAINAQIKFMRICQDENQSDYCFPSLKDASISLIERLQKDDFN